MSDFNKTYTGYEGEHDAIIQFENATNNAIRNCKLLNAGFNGININLYAQKNTIYGCVIENAGYNGIYLTGYGIGEGKFSSAAQSYVNKFNTISNNIIRNCGKNIGHGSGVQLFNSGDNEISYNKIELMPRYGISLKGSMRYGGMEYEYYGTEVTWENHWDFIHSRNNKIKFNDISKCLLDSQDAGGIEAWSCGTNNIIDNNRIHDIKSGIPDGLTMGIYIDDAADYFTVKNNIIYNIRGTNVHSVFMKGAYNTFTNNIIANNDSNISMNFWAMAGERNDNLVLTNNIIYNSGKTIYRFQDWTDDKVSKSDNNVIYHPSGEYDVLGIRGVDTWKSWTGANGGKFDKKTIVADPLFIDAKNNNYTVKANSPALKNGFKNIDLKSIGPNTNLRLKSQ